MSLRALNTSERHLDANPQSVDALVSAGIAAFDAGAHAEAQTRLERALALAPQHPACERARKVLFSVYKATNDAAGGAALLIDMVASAESPKHTVDRATRLSAALYAAGRSEAAAAVLSAAVRAADAALGGGSSLDPCAAPLPDSAAPAPTPPLPPDDAADVARLRSRALVSLAEARLALLLPPPPPALPSQGSGVSTVDAAPPHQDQLPVSASRLSPPLAPPPAAGTLQSRLASELWGPPAVAAARAVAAALLDCSEGSCVGPGGEASEPAPPLEMGVQTAADWAGQREGPPLPLLLPPHLQPAPAAAFPSRRLPSQAAAGAVQAAVQLAADRVKAAWATGLARGLVSTAATATSAATAEATAELLARCRLGDLPPDATPSGARAAAAADGLTAYRSATADLAATAAWALSRLLPRWAVESAPPASPQQPGSAGAADAAAAAVAAHFAARVESHSWHALPPWLLDAAAAVSELALAWAWPALSRPLALALAATLRTVLRLRGSAAAGGQMQQQQQPADAAAASPYSAAVEAVASGLLQASVPSSAAATSPRPDAPLAQRALSEWLALAPPARAAAPPWLAAGLNALLLGAAKQSYEVEAGCDERRSEAVAVAVGPLRAAYAAAAALLPQPDGGTPAAAASAAPQPPLQPRPSPFSAALLARPLPPDHGLSSLCRALLPPAAPFGGVVATLTVAFPLRGGAPWLTRRPLPAGPPPAASAFVVDASSGLMTALRLALAETHLEEPRAIAPPPGLSAAPAAAVAAMRAAAAGGGRAMPPLFNPFGLVQVHHAHHHWHGGLAADASDAAAAAAIASDPALLALDVLAAAEEGAAAAEAASARQRGASSDDPVSAISPPVEAAAPVPARGALPRWPGWAAASLLLGGVAEQAARQRQRPPAPPSHPQQQLLQSVGGGLQHQLPQRDDAPTGPYAAAALFLETLASLGWTPGAGRGDTLEDARAAPSLHASGPVSADTRAHVAFIAAAALLGAAAACTRVATSQVARWLPCAVLAGAGERVVLPPGHPSLAPIARCLADARTLLASALPVGQAPAEASLCAWQAASARASVLSARLLLMTESGRGETTGGAPAAPLSTAAAAAAEAATAVQLLSELLSGDPAFARGQAGDATAAAATAAAVSPPGPAALPGSCMWPLAHHSDALFVLEPSAAPALAVAGFGGLGAPHALLLHCDCWATVEAHAVAAAASAAAAPADDPAATDAALDALADAQSYSVEALCTYALALVRQSRHGGGGDALPAAAAVYPRTASIYWGGGDGDATTVSPHQHQQLAPAGPLAVADAVAAVLEIAAFAHPAAACALADLLRERAAFAAAPEASRSRLAASARLSAVVAVDAKTPWALARLAARGLEAGAAAVADAAAARATAEHHTRAAVGAAVAAAAPGVGGAEAAVLSPPPTLPLQRLHSHRLMGAAAAGGGGGGLLGSPLRLRGRSGSDGPSFGGAGADSGGPAPQEVARRRALVLDAAAQEQLDAAEASLHRLVGCLPLALGSGAPLLVPLDDSDVAVAALPGRHSPPAAARQGAPPPPLLATLSRAFSLRWAHGGDESGSAPLAASATLRAVSRWPRPVVEAAVRAHAGLAARNRLCGQVAAALANAQAAAGLVAAWDGAGEGRLPLVSRAEAAALLSMQGACHAELAQYAQAAACLAAAVSLDPSPRAVGAWAQLAGAHRSLARRCLGDGLAGLGVLHLQAGAAAVRGAIVALAAASAASQPSSNGVDDSRASAAREWLTRLSSGLSEHAVAAALAAMGAHNAGGSSVDFASVQLMCWVAASDYAAAASGASCASLPHAQVSSEPATGAESKPRAPWDAAAAFLSSAPPGLAPAALWKAAGDLFSTAYDASPSAYGPVASALALGDRRALAQLLQTQMRGEEGSVDSPTAPLPAGTSAAAWLTASAPFQTASDVPTVDVPSAGGFIRSAALAACQAYALAVDAAAASEAATSSLPTAAGTPEGAAPLAAAAAPQSSLLCGAWCDLGRALYLCALAARRAAGGSGLGLWLEGSRSGSSAGGLHGVAQRYIAVACAAAVRAHAQAVRHSPASARAWNGLGVCATALGTPALAQHALARSVALGGGGIALVNLGALYTAGGRLRAATEVLLQAQNKDSNNEPMWLTHGSIHEGVLRVQEARLRCDAVTGRLLLPSTLAPANEEAKDEGAADRSGAAALFSKAAGAAPAAASGAGAGGTGGGAAAAALLSGLGALATKAASSYSLAAQLSAHAAAQVPAALVLLGARPRPLLAAASTGINRRAPLLDSHSLATSTTAAVAAAGQGQAPGGGAAAGADADSLSALAAVADAANPVALCARVAALARAAHDATAAYEAILGDGRVALGVGTHPLAAAAGPLRPVVFGIDVPTLGAALLPLLLASAPTGGGSGDALASADASSRSLVSNSWRAVASAAAAAADRIRSLSRLYASPLAGSPSEGGCVGFSADETAGVFAAAPDGAAGRELLRCDVAAAYALAMAHAYTPHPPCCAAGTAALLHALLLDLADAMCCPLMPRRNGGRVAALEEAEAGAAAEVGGSRGGGVNAAGACVVHAALPRTATPRWSGPSFAGVLQLLGGGGPQHAEAAAATAPIHPSEQGWRVPPPLLRLHACLAAPDTAAFASLGVIFDAAAVCALLAAAAGQPARGAELCGAALSLTVRLTQGGVADEGDDLGRSALPGLAAPLALVAARIATSAALVEQAPAQQGGSGGRGDPPSVSAEVAAATRAKGLPAPPLPPLTALGLLQSQHSLAIAAAAAASTAASEAAHSSSSPASAVPLPLPRLTTHASAASQASSGGSSPAESPRRGGAASYATQQSLLRRSLATCVAAAGAAAASTASAAAPAEQSSSPAPASAPIAPAQAALALLRSASTLATRAPAVWRAVAELAGSGVLLQPPPVPIEDGAAAVSAKAAAAGTVGPESDWGRGACEHLLRVSHACLAAAERGSLPSLSPASVALLLASRLSLSLAGQGQAGEDASDAAALARARLDGWAAVAQRAASGSPSPLCARSAWVTLRCCAAAASAAASAGAPHAPAAARLAAQAAAGLAQTRALLRRVHERSASLTRMFAGGGEDGSGSPPVAALEVTWLDASASALAPQLRLDAVALYDPADTLGEACDAATATAAPDARGGGSDAGLSQWDVVLLSPDGGGGAGGPLSLSSAAAAGVIVDVVLAGLSLGRMPAAPGADTSAAAAAAAARLRHLSPAQGAAPPLASQ